MMGDPRPYFRQRSFSNSAAFCPIMSSHAYISLWNRLHFLCVLFMRCCRIFVFAGIFPTQSKQSIRLHAQRHVITLSLWLKNLLGLKTHIHKPGKTFDMRREVFKALVYIHIPPPTTPRPNINENHQQQLSSGKKIQNVLLRCMSFCIPEQVAWFKNTKRLSIPCQLSL